MFRFVLYILTCMLAWLFLGEWYPLDRSGGFLVEVLNIILYCGMQSTSTVHLLSVIHSEWSRVELDLLATSTYGVIVPPTITWMHLYSTLLNRPKKKNPTYIQYALLPFPVPIISATPYVLCKTYGGANSERQIQTDPTTTLQTESIGYGVGVPCPHYVGTRTASYVLRTYSSIPHI